MFAMGMTRNRQSDRDRKVHDAAVRRAVARQQVNENLKEKKIMKG
jgi:hypothetical protein